MNDNLIPDLTNAWAWFDRESGLIKHVGFIEDQLPEDENLLKTSIETGTATDIITGVSNLSHYKVVMKNDTPVVVYLASNLLNMISVFWSLTELVPFDRKWLPWDEPESPVRLVSTETGYDLYVVSYSANSKLYITLKEDPSWLVKTVDIPTAIANNGLGPIPITLDISRNYSVYVRQDATQH